MNNLADAMAASPDTGADRMHSEAGMQLELEKLAIERDRLSLEREKLEAEREKWRADAIWKQRAEGRFGLSAPVLMAGAALFCLIGGIVGAITSRALKTDTLDRSDMARRIAQAMQSSTNVSDRAQGRFLLRALTDEAPPATEGGYLVILE